MSLVEQVWSVGRRVWRISELGRARETREVKRLVLMRMVEHDRSPPLQSNCMIEEKIDAAEGDYVVGGGRYIASSVVEFLLCCFHLFLTEVIEHETVVKIGAVGLAIVRGVSSSSVRPNSISRADRGRGTRFAAHRMSRGRET